MHSNVVYVSSECLGEPVHLLMLIYTFIAPQYDKFQTLVCYCPASQE